jgi:hypothetical protein
VASLPHDILPLTDDEAHLLDDWDDESDVARARPR